MVTTMTDNELLRRFEDLTLPFEQWMHRAHVKVAYLYLRAQGFAEALKCLRRGIQAYNVKNNVPDNATSGYNETTTHAFLYSQSFTSLWVIYQGIRCETFTNTRSSS